jgi:hypothetical protein
VTRDDAIAESVLRLEETHATLQSLTAKTLKAIQDQAQTGQDELQTKAEGIEASAIAVARQIAEEAGVQLGLKLTERFLGLQTAVLEQVSKIEVPAGAPGAPGRDAKINPPVTWVAGQQHHYNDWVKHANGVWHCYRDTDAEPSTKGDCGWTLLFGGVADVGIDIDPVDPRNATLLVKLTNGIERAVQFRIPGLIGRGPWKESAHYSEGDVVSHEGSAWTAKRDSVASKPGTSGAIDDWIMTVKRGKDAIPVAAERGLRYLGPYEIGMRNAVNDLVRTRQAIWICTKVTENPPSNATPLEWQVFVPLE